MQALSSDDWTALTDTKWKLLENFVRHVAQSDLKTKPKQSKKPQASDILKSHLTAELNQLVCTLSLSSWFMTVSNHNSYELGKHLKPPFDRCDCHPKTSSPHITMKSWTIKGAIKLECIQADASRMTDEIITTPFEKMSAQIHQIWLSDIHAGFYTVAKIKAGGPSDNLDVMKDVKEDDHKPQEGLTAE
jgi:hypothetical protein